MLVKIRVGDVFFENRLGNEDRIPLEKCKDVFEVAGFVRRVIGKINKISFRVEGIDVLYSYLPEKWLTLKEVNLESHIAKEVYRSSYNIVRIKKAYEMLSGESKKEVVEILKEMASFESRQFYLNKLEVPLQRLGIINFKETSEQEPKLFIVHRNDGEYGGAFCAEVVAENTEEAIEKLYPDYKNDKDNDYGAYEKKIDGFEIKLIKKERKNENTNTPAGN